MTVVRTPDERFSDLPGYPFSPHYVTVKKDSADSSAGTLRVHFLDEGDGQDGVILCLHGEPSWSYLYRKMIPILTSKGHRVIAPDLVGFGKSDKPSERTDYTYARHVEWMRSALFDGLDLTNITLVCQDWGGLIGLRLVGEHPDRFRSVVVANTGMPTGDTPMGEAFMNWQKFSQDVPEMPIGFIVNGGTATELSPEIIAAYDAPFPDETYKEGARQFPMLVPTRPDDPASDANRKAWEVLRTLKIPFLCAFSDSDPITKGGERAFLEQVPGANGQKHTTIKNASHFLQEDNGEDLAEAVLSLFN